jgi:hypothetical protein
MISSIGLLRGSHIIPAGISPEQQRQTCLARQAWQKNRNFSLPLYAMQQVKLHDIFLQSSVIAFRFNGFTETDVAH